MRKFPGRLVNFTRDYMVARRFGRAVRVYMRARARVCVHACEVLVSVSHAHTSNQASKFGLIRAIVPALMSRGGGGRGGGNPSRVSGDRKFQFYG